ncbi:hypothetical protein MGYG_02204 [Nannizzia gypsea CBS 118893]|uniref:F-box domain-containing protein n=1 Tax=Arthroderma gypseum (strain ATCC MYA-4604 / CBS 118893) TaxID=535722 RepID=E4UQA9_ARTGP|nr:hypothetical protein MGYG_02204 [Nannizzia gypsea CBS 118893]EFQ99190.1 hypothetical protein MGYG_02204 [Nannizzia gypsea CBS 118893]
MDYYRPCNLCGMMIDSKCSGVEMWKALFQLIKLKDISGGPSPLISPSTMSRRAVYVTHSACWSIVTMVIGTKLVEPKWIDNFCYVLRDIGPILPAMQFPDCPEVPDNADCADSELVEEGDLRGISSTFCGVYLPPEIIQTIYQHLNYQDLCHMRRLTGIEPNIRTWFSVGRKYLAYRPQFLAEGSRQEISNKIERLLWNVHHCAESIPSICNYSVVWDNVEALLQQMGQSFSSIEADPPIRYIPPLSPWPNISIEHTINLYSLCQISLNFCYVLDRRYLCGFKIGHGTVGYTGELTITVSLQEFGGLRIVSDKEGILGVQVKNISWQKDWYGSLAGLGDLMFDQIEWAVGSPAKLIASFDTFKIHKISIFNDTNPSQYQSQSWKHRLPPENLTPVFLTNHRLFDCTLPLSPVGRKLDTADAIAAFVDAKTEALTAFSLKFGNIEVQIGDPFHSAAKLSFYVNSQANEKFTGIACAASDKPTALAVKDNWGDLRRVSVVGVLQPAPEKQYKSTNNFIPTIQYQITTIKIGPIGPISVFVSSARFIGVSQITIYREPETTSLCGIKVLHENGFSDMLGQDNEVAQVCTPQGKLIYIRVFYDIIYGVNYLVKGLRFGFPSYTFDVGSLEGDMVEDIGPSTVTLLILALWPQLLVS